MPAILSGAKTVSETLFFPPSTVELGCGARHLDERLRLGTASGGGRFVFGRGGKAETPLADGWAEVLERLPTDGRKVLAVAGLATAAAVLRR